MSKKKPKESTSEENLIAFLCLLLIYPFLWAWSGLVFKIMWGWFVIPIGAPAVTVAQGVGLAALVMLVRNNRKEDEDTSLYDELPGIVVRSTFIPAYILLVGWIAHWFMP